jgi:hypothetical protein
MSSQKKTCYAVEHNDRIFELYNYWFRFNENQEEITELRNIATLGM